MYIYFVAIYRTDHIFYKMTSNRSDIFISERKEENNCIMYCIHFIRYVNQLSTSLPSTILHYTISEICVILIHMKIIFIYNNVIYNKRLFT